MAEDFDPKKFLADTEPAEPEFDPKKFLADTEPKMLHSGTGLPGTMVPPSPYRDATAGETIRGHFNEAMKKIGEAYEGITSDVGKPTWSGSAMAPFSGAANIAKAASGIGEAILSPVTAAWTHNVGVPIEKRTGIPESDISLGTLTGLAGSKGALGPAPGGWKVPGTAGPARPSNLPRYVNREGATPVDLGQLEQAMRAPVDMGQLARDIGVEDIGAPVQGPVPVRPPVPQNAPAPPAALAPEVLEPNIPHESIRPSVGAQGVQGDPLVGYDPEAVKLMRGAMGEEFNEHTLEQAIDENSAHHMLGELAGPESGLENKMAAVATNPGEERTMIAGALRERRMQEPQRMRALFDRTFGDYTSVRGEQALIKQQRKLESAPFWEQFHGTPIPPTPELVALTPRLRASGALGAAEKRLATRGAPKSFDWLDEGPLKGDVQRLPTSTAYQLANEYLGKKIGKAVKAGDAGAVRDLTELKNALTAAIDNHPNPNVAGIWQAARNKYAQHSKIIDAINLGRDILTNKVHHEDIPRLLQGLGDPERRGVIIGMRGHLEDQLGRPGSMDRRLINDILSGTVRRKLMGLEGSGLLPQGAADTLLRGVEHEHAMFDAPVRIVKGSPTAGRLRAQSFGQPPESFVNKITPGQIVHAVVHPKGAVAHAIGKGLGKVAGLGAQSPRQIKKYERVRRDLARIMTLQGPERDAVARALLNSSYRAAGGRIERQDGGGLGDMGGDPGGNPDLPVMVDPIERERQGAVVGSNPAVQKAARSLGRSVAEDFGTLGRVMTGRSENLPHDVLTGAMTVLPGTWPEKLFYKASKAGIKQLRPERAGGGLVPVPVRGMAEGGDPDPQPLDRDPVGFEPGKYDPFEIAAARARESVMPFRGRQESGASFPVQRALKGAGEAIRSYPEEYRTQREGALQQMREAMEDRPVSPWGVAKDIGKFGLGASGYVSSPMTAAVTAGAERPISGSLQAAGVPEGPAEFAGHLAGAALNQMVPMRAPQRVTVAAPPRNVVQQKYGQAAQTAAPETAREAPPRRGSVGPADYGAQKGYEGTSAPDAGGVVDRIYQPTGPGSDYIRERGGDTPVYHELNPERGADLFYRSIKDAKEASPHGAAVTLYDPADYQKSRLFVTPDRKAGFALKDDDVISVFKHPDAPNARRLTRSMLNLAVAEGGRRLDAFDTALPHLYSENGFRAVARLPFSDEHAPAGWQHETFARHNGGRPDVVFMVHDPAHGKPYAPGDGTPVSTYEEGLRLQQEALKGRARGGRAMAIGGDPMGDDDAPPKQQDDDGSVQVAGDNYVPQNSSSYLADQRSRFGQEMQDNPAVRHQLRAILSLENEGAGPGVVESLMNRQSMTGGSLAAGMGGGANSFYGPVRHGLVGPRMREIGRDPAWQARLDRSIDQALGGSNLVKGHTDQGSRGDPNYVRGGVGVNINGERFNHWGGYRGVDYSRAWTEEQQRRAEAGDWSGEPIAVGGVGVTGGGGGSQLPHRLSLTVGAPAQNPAQSNEQASNPFAQLASTLMQQPQQQAPAQTTTTQTGPFEEQAAAGLRRIAEMTEVPYERHRKRRQHPAMYTAGGGYVPVPVRGYQDGGAPEVDELPAEDQAPAASGFSRFIAGLNPIGTAQALELPRPAISRGLVLKPGTKEFNKAATQAKAEIAAGPKGAGPLDLSGDNVIRDVPQTPLERWNPPRGVSPRMTEALQNPEVEAGVRQSVQEGIQEYGADVWYHTRPIREAFMAELGPRAGADAFNKYMHIVAATSPRSDASTNVRNASYYYHLLTRGNDPNAAIELPAKNPQPYGHLAQGLHREMVADIIKAYREHPDAAQPWDLFGNPKPASFSANLRGNLVPGTIDTHAFRNIGMRTGDPRFLVTSTNELVKGGQMTPRQRELGEFREATKEGKDPAVIYRPQQLLREGRISMDEALNTPMFWQAQPNPNEYAAAEQLYARIAHDLGLPVADVQAAAWAGAGRLTGLESPPTHSFPELFNERVYFTSKLRNEAPHTTLRRFIRGEAPLFSKGGVVEYVRRLDEAERRAKGGRVLSTKTRTQSHYSHDRGTHAKHCANCSMFRAPHSCTAVAGHIAKMGLCDWWEKKRG